MVQLDLDNIYLQITNLDESDEKKIWNILSFPLQIYGMTEIRYRHLYNRKTKKTYAGLLPYVVEYLDKEGIEYQVNDNRVKPQQDGNFKLVDYIDDKKEIPFKLRPYQQEIVDNCNEREIIQACTGAGKTCMMAALIAKFNVKPVCIFADKIGLCMQLKSEMEKFLGVDVGLVGDGVKDYKDITVISAQSAEEDYIKNANIVMWDECLPYNAKVMLADGKYKEICRIVSDLNKGENVFVMSYNTKTNGFEAKPVVDYGKISKNNRKMMKIKIKTSCGEEKIIQCTDNHKVWVESKQQYVEAKDLIIGDSVVAVNKTYECPLCSFTSVNKNAFWGHVNSAHGSLNKKKEYVCPICNEKLQCSVANYNLHIKFHDEEFNMVRNNKIKNAKLEFYQDKTKSAFALEKMQKYMELNNPMYDEAVKEKMIISRKKYFKELSDKEYSVVVRNFINASNNIFNKITSNEQVIIDLMMPNLVYNGSITDSKTYRFLENEYKKSGTPDFIYYGCDGTIKFVECFGRYWHTDEEEFLIINAYKKIGFDAIVIWEDEPIDVVKQKLSKFLGENIYENSISI